MSDVKFTQEQKDYICYKIGEWYFSWKERLVNYEDKVHRLGYAKEILKTMICDSEDEIKSELQSIVAGLKHAPGIIDE